MNEIKNQIFDQYRDGQITQEELICQLEEQVGIVPEGVKYDDVTEDDNCTKPTISEECQRYMPQASNFVYESLLRRISNRANPETMALGDFVEALMLTTHNAIKLATTSSKHINNILVVFGNYMANTAFDNEVKTEKMQTQLWLIDIILGFAKNYNSITEANDILCEFSEMVDNYKEITL